MPNTFHELGDVAVVRIDAGCVDKPGCKNCAGVELVPANPSNKTIQMGTHKCIQYFAGCDGMQAATDGADVA